MKKFEYTSIPTTAIEDSTGQPDLRHLTAVGNNGWDLTHVTATHYLFKRESTPTEFDKTMEVYKQVLSRKGGKVSPDFHHELKSAIAETNKLLDRRRK